MINLKEVVEGYLGAALWAETDEEGNPLDDEFSVEDFSKEAIKEAEEVVKDFVESNKEDAAEWVRLGRSSDSFGHDFWLTRNGHGMGFWDRGMGDLGERLSESSKVYGNAYAYAGDDDLLYFS